MSENKTPIMQIVEKLKDPSSSLTEEEKDKIKNMTGDVGSAVKTSLVQLLMGQFNKVDMYDAAIKTVMDNIMQTVPIMEVDDQIALLSVLTKTSTSEVKNVMDLFKKQGDDFKELIKELQKLSGKKPVVNEDGSPVKEETGGDAFIDLSPQKRDQIARFINKISSKPKLDE